MAEGMLVSMMNLSNYLELAMRLQMPVHFRTRDASQEDKTRSGCAERVQNASRSCCRKALVGSIPGCSSNPYNSESCTCLQQTEWLQNPTNVYKAP